MSMSIQRSILGRTLRDHAVYERSADEGLIGRPSLIKYNRATLLMSSILFWSLSACTLISSPDSFTGANEDLNATTCIIQGTASASWWEGSWDIDVESLSKVATQSIQTAPHQLLNARALPSVSPTTTSVQNTPQETSSARGQSPRVSRTVDPVAMDLTMSLALAFHLKVSRQQATLTLDQDHRRLATRPLPYDQGVKLIGHQEAFTLWCEGSQVFWSSSKSRPVPLIRIQPSPQ